MHIIMDGFVYEGKVDGTLTSRHTIALTTDDGVVNLGKSEVVEVLPALQHFAEHGQDLED